MGKGTQYKAGECDMKNKEKYDLTTLTAQAFYMTDGCGKKLPMKTVKIYHDGEVIHEENSRRNYAEILFAWLESE